MTREVESPGPDPVGERPPPLDVVSDDDESVPDAMRSPRRRPPQGHVPREGDNPAGPSVISSPEGATGEEGSPDDALDNDRDVLIPQPDPEPDDSDIVMKDNDEVQNEHFPGSGNSGGDSDRAAEEPTQQPI